MSAVVIWHNPRCSKSREALALLRARGIEPEIVPYLETPPSPAEIGRILDLLGMEPRALMRRKELAYRAGGFADPALSREALIAAMAETPVLIERPVVLSGGKAVLGRPPEAILSILP